jgi:putative DNA primase/helicase
VARDYTSPEHRAAAAAREGVERLGRGLRHVPGRRGRRRGHLEVRAVRLRGVAAPTRQDGGDVHAVSVEDDDIPPDEAAPEAQVVSIEDERARRRGEGIPNARNAWAARLIRKKDEIQPILANVVTIVANEPTWAGLLTFDELQQSILTMRSPPWDPDDAPAPIPPGEWTQTDDARLVCWLSRHVNITVPPALVRDAVDVVARQRTLHPVRDYLQGVSWDGVPRLDSWLTDYLGVRPTRYSSAVGRMFLISAVARAMQPGCKVDTMPILEGPQGALKSTAVRTLFGAPYVSDTPINFEDKDRFVALRGRWCIEMAELDGLDRGDINRIKSYLSSAQDDFRPPYGRYMARFPRQCVFFGTVNGSDYLRDPTGGRRFWPVRVAKTKPIDIDALARDRDQLWAEARFLHEDGKAWWPPAELLADFEQQQQGRVKSDEWQGAIEKWVADRAFVTVGEVLSFALGIHEEAKWTQSDQNRVASCLQAMGMTRSQRRINGARVRGYALVDEEDDATAGTGVTGRHGSERPDP